MHRLLTSLLVALVVACEVPPRYVEEAAEVDAFLLRSAYRSACVGLEARDEELRTYTAKRLVDYEHVKVANDCLCNALFDAETGSLGTAVAKGVETSRRDDLAQCMLPALDDARVVGEDRVALVRALGGIEAKAAYRALSALARTDPDPAVRTEAARALRPSRGSVDTLMTVLAGDLDPSVRAAAAQGLAGHQETAALDALRAAARSDPDGTVRAAAVVALTDASSTETDQALCDALLGDADDGVRAAVVTVWHGTKRERNLACIDKRMGMDEASGSVRMAILDTLKASPSTLAADMLCRNIGPWVRRHIHKIYLEIPGSDIVKAQNDRDFERSYECVARALRQGGYSCYGKNYLGAWMRELGGSAPTPWCPGMERN